MQLLITHDGTARTRVLQFSRLQLAAVAVALLLALIGVSGAAYHFVFVKAARDGWPVVSTLVHLLVRDEIAQRDRFMRENLDAIAERVGEMQARMVRLEVMGERVSGLAGVKAEDLKPLPSRTGGGTGGPFVPLRQPSMEQLQQAVAGLETAASENTDLFTLVESRLLETRLQALMIPNTPPVDGPVASGFGFRTDPITGRAALHTGLDFPAEAGTPVHAAAGGVVREAAWHAEYGQTLEIDHGNGLVTRYAHNSKLLAAAGMLVRRGQLVAEVGNSGRSTGPHLHFEVLVDGVPQDPARFLAGNGAAVAARRR